MFLATANTTATIPAALLDRMEVIHVPGYTHVSIMHFSEMILNCLICDLLIGLHCTVYSNINLSISFTYQEISPNFNNEKYNYNEI
jgi:hypothetical protein